MGGSTHVTYTAAALVLGGGGYAFLSKGSRASLAASILVSGALAMGGVITSSGKDFEGHALSCAASSALATFGLYRLTTTRKPFPAIPLLALGFSVAAYEYKKVLEWI